MELDKEFEVRGTKFIWKTDSYDDVPVLYYADGLTPVFSPGDFDDVRNNPPDGNEKHVRK